MGYLVLMFIVLVVLSPVDRLSLDLALIGSELLSTRRDSSEIHRALILTLFLNIRIIT
jgi:hypothetical protein